MEEVHKDLWILINIFCGISIVVVRDLPKVEIRVRFPYSAQRDEKF